MNIRTFICVPRSRKKTERCEKNASCLRLDLNIVFGFFFPHAEILEKPGSFSSRNYHNNKFIPRKRVRETKTGFLCRNGKNAPITFATLNHMLITARDNGCCCLYRPSSSSSSSPRPPPELDTPSFVVFSKRPSPFWCTSDFYGQVQERSDGRRPVGVGSVFGPVGVHDKELGGHGRQAGTSEIRKDRLVVVVHIARARSTSVTPKSGAIFVLVVPPKGWPDNSAGSAFPLVQPPGNRLKTTCAPKSAPAFAYSRSSRTIHNPPPPHLSKKSTSEWRYRYYFIKLFYSRQFFRAFVRFQRRKSTEQTVLAVGSPERM